MASRQVSRKRFLLRVELLEARTVLSPLVVWSASMEGPQVAVVQGYNSASSTVSAILDTGSPSVTFSETARNHLGIPVLVAGGATATGIGGSLRGDVSMPGAIYVNGTQTSPRTPGIQAFLGTAAGSPYLPTVAGTPIFEPSAVNPAGLAGLISLPTTQGTGASLQLVSPQTNLVASSGNSLVNISLSLSGVDNHLNPGNQVTVAPVPIDTSVTLAENSTTASDSDFLFDTGSQVTILSPALASSLGINVPQTTNPLQGAGGSATGGGFVLSSLTLGNAVTFMNVPVTVLNIGSGFDGVLGMNLFNHATSMLYNPYGQGGASLSVVFPASPNPVSPATSSPGFGSGVSYGSGTTLSGKPPGSTLEISVALNRSVMSLTGVPTSYYGSGALLGFGQQGSVIFGLQISFAPTYNVADVRSAGRVIFLPVHQSPLQLDATHPGSSRQAEAIPSTPSENSVPDRVPERSSESDSSDQTQPAIPDFQAQDLSRLPALHSSLPSYENAEDGFAAPVSETDTFSQLAVIVAGVWGSLYRDDSASEEARRRAS